MNNKTIIELGFRIVKNYGYLGGCYPPQPSDSTITPSSISIILLKILSLNHLSLMQINSYCQFNLTNLLVHGLGKW